MRYSKQDTRIENAYRVGVMGFDGVVRSHFRFNGLCAFCGDDFKSVSPLAKYCSLRCANDSQIKRRKDSTEKKRLESEICVICNKPIEQTGAKIRYYCGLACKQKAYRQKQLIRNI